MPLDLDICAPIASDARYTQEMRALEDAVDVHADGTVVAAGGLVFLHPEDTVWDAMLTGFRNQQLRRNLSHTTIAQRESLVVRFMHFTNLYPWRWHPIHVDEFFGDLRAERRVAQSTARSYQNAVRAFCGYLAQPAYGGDVLCESLFGTIPVQICFDWNTALHVQACESQPRKRPFTRDELQTLFDFADEQTARVGSRGVKGWRAAFRDATIFKTAYAWGLRRNEVRRLQSVDFSRNPHAREFGKYGVLRVRYGKAMKGSPAKRRSVLTVFDWSSKVIDEWVQRGTADYRSMDLFTTERDTLVSSTASLTRLREYCRELEFSEGLDFHSFRRSYVTHLIEAGMDALFVQQQVGHEHASTTSLYTAVSSDYRVKTLRRALDSTIAAALNGTEPS